ncbi:hypothetical protein ABZ478_10125 [Streptomyces sp. NPDC005706]|uniref:hypothetical protein n=1 Tax=Streptomyces sp. NPDC005706 TaxID=3157169 RepID=UPI0034026E0A
MHALTPNLIVLGCLAVVPVVLMRLARAIRRRGSVGGGVGAALAAYEEAFRATSHASHIEIRAQADRKSPTGSPDGPRPGSWKGPR